MPSFFNLYSSKVQKLYKELTLCMYVQLKTLHAAAEKKVFFKFNLDLSLKEPYQIIVLVPFTLTYTLSQKRTLMNLPYWHPCKM